ncbi:MAG TPA: type II toxin-antitoxin system VapC family toxin [Polyangia bacterium]
MIIPDLNLLVYAHNADAPSHRAARVWWEKLLTGGEPVALPWVVILGYVRLMTHPAVLERPLRPVEALADVRRWLARPCVELLTPGPRHLELLEQALGALGVGGNLTTDAHLAALALEYQCELHSNDRDFGRFSGLRWRDPLA